MAVNQRRLEGARKAVAAFNAFRKDTRKLEADITDMIVDSLYLASVKNLDPHEILRVAAARINSADAAEPSPPRL